MTWATKLEARTDQPVLRRRILRVSALAFFAALAVLMLLNTTMKSTGGPGLLEFEFAGTRQRALEIMREWGHKGVIAARWANLVDFAFLAAYAAFLTAAVAGARRRAIETGRPALARTARLVVALPLVAAAADAIQNAALLLLLGRHAERLAPPLAFGCGVVTSTLAAITVAYLAVVRFSRSASRE